MDTISWLLEDANPAVKYRTQTELLGQSADVSKAKDWIYGRLPEDWFGANGLWYVYYVTALAQCGLTKKDIPYEHIEKALVIIREKFECGCGDFMLLNALVKLGYDIQNIARDIAERMLTDGGFLCVQRMNKLKYTPKSCYKANLHALMFLSEYKKQGGNIKPFQGLIDYFLDRAIFYKSTDKSALVINSREGWRTIDTFYPFEVMRVGLQNIVESLSALGYGNDARLNEAWNLLHDQKDENGRVILRGTMAKSYLPKEKVGKPSKWATFYSLLAEKYRNQGMVGD